MSRDDDKVMLYLHAANAGTTLTREQILEALWETDFVIESNVVDRYVRALQTKPRTEPEGRGPRTVA